ncbi:glycosyltransferase family A protein [Octadecabacter sp. 1_MG-2023]|uniref:glycosyltransferase family 2 protein n=1 Tax=unclassified Octadecabacter TaxID=196158 RepID=UPI001C09F6AA|nr:MULTISPECIES: glycosyltransferase family A protein [unclassified Octadecabacter]MBU2994496.1 glycosyltransferase [Octadecabacter sp. B2R22]MDO6734211.1 glycosyltransferase family A protein [Octadecabacter sp. 1_MG-2023]
MPVASIIVPAFNVSATVSQTLDALLAQTFTDFEIIVVDDGSTDATSKVLSRYADDLRIRIIYQRNRGLAGARNTGIDAADGLVIGFCDADDIWEPTKLAAHIEHFRNRPDVGISYSGSSLINDDGADMGLAQSPQLQDISAAHILKRNPIGNGSTAVIRREVFREIAYRPKSERVRNWYFDETFRQSEDIECWLRIALTTDWEFEGVEGLLTRYRINSKGLSANTDQQLAAWERMVTKLSSLHPAFFARHVQPARAYQLRYLARRAISDLDSNRAVEMTKASFGQSMRPFVEEPAKTLSTLGATMVLRYGGPTAISVLMQRKAT